MTQSRQNRRVLVIGIDGMRPDMFDPELMPSLAALVESGVRASEYHSVYPTHTRAINTTLATGCTPGAHGWVANVFRYAGATEDGIINTADVEHVRLLDDATGLNAILKPTMGDILARYGKKVGLATTQSSGASLIWSRKQPYPIATVSSTYNRDDMRRMRDIVGEVPETDPVSPSKIPQLHWAKRAVIDLFLDDPDVEMTMFYMIEPDFSLHYYGLGAPEVDIALGECDAAVGEIINAMDQRGIRDQFDIIVLSDHGHSTTIASHSLTEHLERALSASNGTLPGLTTASDYIYPLPGRSAPAASELEPIVRWLQEQEWTGAVFGRAEYAKLPGVFPFSAVWNGIEGPRAPLLGVNPAWSSDVNQHGVPGLLAALTEQASLRSTHGSCSPFEMHAFWAASGPSFREGVTTETPAGATDLLPTVLALLGIDAPVWIDGRVMWETMNRPMADVPDPAFDEIVPAVLHPDGFLPTLALHRVGRTSYIHSAHNGHPASFADAETSGVAKPAGKDA